MAERRKWTDEEDAIIAQARARFGIDWIEKVIPLLPHRTPAAIRQHAYNYGVDSGTEKPEAVRTRPATRTQLPVVAVVAERKSAVPARERIPDFLRDDFARWGVAS